MAARIIDGKRIAAAVREEIRERIRRLRQDNLGVPGLAVIVVGDDPASAAYVRSKTTASEEVGIASRQITFPAFISHDELIGSVQELNRYRKGVAAAVSAAAAPVVGAA